MALYSIEINRYKTVVEEVGGGEGRGGGGGRKVTWLYLRAFKRGSQGLPMWSKGVLD